jgi:hypothetical protein
MNKIVNHIYEAGKVEAEMKAVIDALKKAKWDSRDATQIFGITCKLKTTRSPVEPGISRPPCVVRKWVGPLMVWPALLVLSLAPAQQSSSKTRTSGKELVALNGNSSKQL